MRLNPKSVVFGRFLEIFPFLCKGDTKLEQKHPHEICMDCVFEKRHVTDIFLRHLSEAGLVISQSQLMSD